MLKCGQPSNWFLLNEHLVHLEQFSTEAQSTTMTTNPEIQASNCQRGKERIIESVLALVENMALKFNDFKRHPFF